MPSKYVELPGGVILDVTGVDLVEVCRILGRDSVRTAKTEEDFLDGDLPPVAPVKIKAARVPKKKATPTLTNEEKQKEDMLHSRGGMRGRIILEELAKVSLNIRRSSMSSPEVKQRITSEANSQRLAFLPSLDHCKSPRSYVSERLFLLESDEGLRSAFLDEIQCQMVQRPRKPEQWGETVSTSEYRRNEYSRERAERMSHCHQNVVDLLTASRERALTEVSSTNEKIQRIDHAREFKKIAQVLAKSWSRIVTLHSVLLSVRACLLVGYRGKWKSILIYLIFQRWKRQMQHHRTRIGILRFNFFLRRCLPQAVERLRSRRREEHISVIKDYLTKCAAATKFSRVLHTFLESVGRVQRLVRRRILCRKLQVEAVKLTMDKVNLTLIGDKSVGLIFPDCVKFLVANALVKMDIEAMQFDRKTVFEEYLGELENADHSETMKFEGFIHCQSIIAQAAILTIFKSPELVKLTSLPLVAHDYEFSKILSIEARYRLRRWYAKLYLSMQSADAVERTFSEKHPSKKPKETFLTSVSEIPQSPQDSLMLCRSQSSPLAESVSQKLREGPLQKLLNDENQTAVFYRMLDNWLQRRRRQPGRGSIFPASPARNAPLSSQAKQQPQDMIPPFVDGDLSHSVFSAIPPPPFAKRKRLLSVQNMSLLLKMIKDAWVSACRKTVSKTLEEKGFESSVQTFEHKKNLTGVNTVEENQEMTKKMIDHFQATYASQSTPSTQAYGVDLDEVMKIFDLSFLDSYYRRAR